MKTLLFCSAMALCLEFAAAPGIAQDAGPLRRVIDLNGKWQVEQGEMDRMPDAFSRTVPVPGLLDMAEPPFEDVGKPSDLREAFWYRRVFSFPGDVPATALLHLHKARYGSRIFLNGHLVGDHLPSFTPGYFDVRAVLRGGGAENELVIRVGAGREALPEGQPGGWDFEKYRYIPGIYDEVELILTGTPHIANVQVVPDLPTRSARFVVELEGALPGTDVAVSVRVRERGSEEVVAEARASTRVLSGDGPTMLTATAFIENARLWSPEDPFLYEAEVSTEADEVRTRFGMRSFTFDPVTKRALLNGKPYYLRGTNVTAYRFFEDAERGDKPWREEWVRRLHRSFKEMGWNAIRYCIGFPPDFWYEIADEEGFLIQDEFPIWLLFDAPEKPVAEMIIPEYVAWMRTRWNHPSVVIWDAQNESITPETARAIAAVRHLDLSNRPWENGWMSAQSPTDVIEAHPYHFYRGWDDPDQPVFRLKEMPTVSTAPELRDTQRDLPAAVIINEYGWLWLTRDGQPTSLTQRIYAELVGENATVEERMRFYARTLAAETEFWRAHRQVAGVLHFCALAYSRPGDIPRPEGGATSDHFLDVERLEYEPHFREYVGEAFSPVGIMLDFWEEEIAAGARRSFEISVINDLYEDWQGEVRLSLLEGEEELVSAGVEARVEPLGRNILMLELTVPDVPGEYVLVAELRGKDGRRVRSLRDVRVVEEGGN